MGRSYRRPQAEVSPVRPASPPAARTRPEQAARSYRRRAVSSSARRTLSRPPVTVRPANAGRRSVPKRRAALTWATDSRGWAAMIRAAAPATWGRPSRYRSRSRSRFPAGCSGCASRERPGRRSSDRGSRSPRGGRARCWPRRRRRWPADSCGSSHGSDGVPPGPVRPPRRGGRNFGVPVGLMSRRTGAVVATDPHR